MATRTGRMNEGNCRLLIHFAEGGTMDEKKSKCWASTAKKRGDSISLGFAAPACMKSLVSLSSPRLISEPSPAGVPQLAAAAADPQTTGWGGSRAQPPGRERGRHRCRSGL